LYIIVPSQTLSSSHSICARGRHIKTYDNNIVTVRTPRYALMGRMPRTTPQIRVATITYSVMMAHTGRRGSGEKIVNGPKFVQKASARTRCLSCGSSGRPSNTVVATEVADGGYGMMRAGNRFLCGEAHAYARICRKRWAGLGSGRLGRTRAAPLPVELSSGQSHRLSPQFWNVSDVYTNTGQGRTQAGNILSFDLNGTRSPDAGNISCR
jgi:hypothetical protein